jgi:hypothetical protein
MRGAPWCLFLRCVAQVGALALALPASANAEEVRIGARDDTKPFIWRDAETGNYLGFLWDVCTEAVQRAGYTIGVRGVTASERAAFLAQGSGDLDLLCDPTTITLSRMSAFAEGPAKQLAFTQILFVANASHAANTAVGPIIGDETTSCASVTAHGGEQGAPLQTSPHAPETWLDRAGTFVRLRPEQPQPDPVQHRFEIWGFVAGSTSGEFLQRQQRPTTALAEPVICLQAFASHPEAAEALCTARLKRYYGDLDIIRAAIADYNAQAGSICNPVFPEAGGADSRYEPYALVVSSARMAELPERITMAIYSMFTDGTIDRLFAGHFPGQEKNIYLDTLFRLNSIPPGTSPD